MSRFRPAHAGAGKARNKNNARDKVISFFNFAVEKTYLPEDIPHVAKATTAFSDPRLVITTEEEAAASAQPKEVYLPEEMAKLLRLPPSRLQHSCE